jgi:hypothetical protein
VADLVPPERRAAKMKETASYHSARR